MALSGTITGKADNTNYTLTCDWSATQSVSDNTSTITAKVYLKAPSGWSTVSSYWNCTINGAQVTTNKSATVSSTKVLLGTRTWTVTHGSNGALSTSISFSYSNGLTSAGTYTTKSGSGSATVTLNTIPRTSSFTLSSSSLNMGSAQTVTISRASSSFTHTVQYTFGSSTTTAATKSTATTISFTPPTSLASQVPNATSGTCTVKVTTYNGDTSIGSASKTFTLNVPSSVVPSFTSLGLEGVNLLGGVYVAGKSSVKASIYGAAGAYGSSCNTFHISGAGLNSNSWQATSGVLSAGTHTITGKATDTRGRSVSKSGSITVHAYSNPTLSINVYRCDSAGNKNDSGTYVRAKLTYAISNPNGANANAKQYKVERKQSTASSYSVYKDWTNFTGGYTSTSDSTLDLGPDWATTVSYDVRISIRDSYASTSAIQRISTIAAILDIESGGVGVGKLHEQGKLDVGGEIYASGKIKVGGEVIGANSLTINGAKSIKLGVGDSDIYLYNSASKKYLQMRDDGVLAYNGKTISTASIIMDSEIQARKESINTLETTAMSVINQVTVYEYESKDNTNARDFGKKMVGLIIDYKTPKEIVREVEVLSNGEQNEKSEAALTNRGIDLYAMSSLAWKALQEKDKEIKALQNRVEEIEKLTSLIQNVIQQ